MQVPLLELFSSKTFGNLSSVLSSSPPAAVSP